MLDIDLRRCTHDCSRKVRRRALRCSSVRLRVVAHETDSGSAAAATQVGADLIKSSDWIHNQSPMAKQ